MRIIKKGTVPDGNIFSGMCSKCGAIVECTKEEAKPAMYLNHFAIKCPMENCGKDIDLKPGKWGR